MEDHYIHTSGLFILTVIDLDDRNIIHETRIFDSQNDGFLYFFARTNQYHPIDTGVWYVPCLHCSVAQLLQRPERPGAGAAATLYVVEGNLRVRERGAEGSESWGVREGAIDVGIDP